MPGTFEDVITLLIPELQRRGIFWTDFTVPGGTYRENLYEAPGQHEPLPDHPAAKMIWRAPIKAGANGYMNGNGNAVANGYGLGNGWHGEEAEESEGERVDPTSMQLG